eukprot:GHUV01026606.1.p1 GENE.GHUV01026606.1~~GHUV01026606.1.p1  ORF type:complete len:116 (+),score=28.88 GHUV01026606.1:199-546(+)
MRCCVYVPQQTVNVVRQLSAGCDAQGNMSPASTAAAASTTESTVLMSSATSTRLSASQPGRALLVAHLCSLSHPASTCHLIVHHYVPHFDQQCTLPISWYLLFPAMSSAAATAVL